MAYLTSQVARRSDLRVAFPWARSVLCVGLAVRHLSRLLDRRSRGPRLDRALRLGRRLSRRDEGDARPPGRAPRGRSRSLRLADLRGHRADRGACLRGRGRDRSLGEEHLPPASRPRLLVLPGRDRDRPRSPARRAASGHVRELHRLPGRLSHRRAARALHARRHALHQLPDHRGEGAHPGGSARGSGPSRLRLRHLPGRLPLEPQAARARRAGLRGAARARGARPRATSPDSTRRPSASGFARAR